MHSFAFQWTNNRILCKKSYNCICSLQQSNTIPINDKVCLSENVFSFCQKNSNIPLCYSNHCKRLDGKTFSKYPPNVTFIYYQRYAAFYWSLYKKIFYLIKICFISCFMVSTCLRSSTTIWGSRKKLPNLWYKNNIKVLKPKRGRSSTKTRKFYSFIFLFVFNI